MLELDIDGKNMSSIKAKLNTKHLTKGDPLPPYNGKLRLYTMRYCPFAQRVVFTLTIKNIDYEIINIDTKDKPEWFASKSPFTKVPALEISDGLSIWESLVIVEYLDDAYPERPLLPKDPVKKAVDKVLVEACTPLIHAFIVKIVASLESIADDIVAGYYRALDLVQNRLQQKGTKFLNGGEPGYADYMLWPWFERLDALNDTRSQIDKSKYKTLLEYIVNMSKDPLVKEYAIPKDMFKNFYGAYSLKKKPDYEQLREY